MLNKIWFALFFLGFTVAGATGRIQEVTVSLFTSMEQTVKFSLGLIGFLVFWSGMLRIAEEAGVMNFLARTLYPILHRLFPGLPADSPALGAVSLSISANLLGLGNVTTPMGLKAMQELTKLNPKPKEVSNQIAVFLGLVMGGVTLLPSTIIGIRAQAASSHPAVITVPILLSTLAGTIGALCTHLLHTRIKKPKRERY